MLMEKTLKIMKQEAYVQGWQDAADAITEYKLLMEEQKSLVNPFTNLSKPEIISLDKKIFNEYVIIEDRINYASEYITSTITKTKINY